MVALRRFEVLAVVSALTTSVVVGLVIGYATVTLGYAEARLAYAIPTLLVVGVILSQLRRGAVKGLLTPTAMTMVGFLYFFSVPPLLGPEVNSGLYSTPARFWPLVLTYFASVIVMLMGIVTARLSRFGRIRFSFLAKGPDSQSLRYWYTLLVTVFLTMSVVMAWSANISPLELVVRSGYGGTGLNLGHSISRYLFPIFQLLPISIAALSPLMLLERRVSRRFRWFVTVALLVCLLFAFGRGARYVFLYAWGAFTLVSLGITTTEARHISAQRKALLLTCGLVGIVLAIQMGVIRTAGGLGIYVSSGNPVVVMGEMVDVGTDQNSALELVLDSVPSSRPYIWGLSYLSTLVIFIPRDLWPAKPSTAWEYMRGLHITENPNAAYSNIGELYLNFGPTGVIVGMYVWGMVCEVWRRTYAEYRSSLVAMVLYYMSLPAFAFAVRGDFQVAVGSMLYAMLIVFLILKLSVRAGDMLQRDMHTPLGMHGSLSPRTP